MTLSYTYDGAAVTHNAAPTGLQIPTRADLGEASFGGVPFEDPGATMTLLGHRPFTVVESACAQPRLFTGYVTERGIGRDLDRGMFVGDDARLLDTTVVDCNAVFGLRIIWDTDGNRPEETWAERLTWLLASDYLSGLITGTVGAGFVDTWPNPMDAADYRGAFPKAVLDDLAQRFEGAVNYFAFWNPAESRVELFFDHVDQGIGLCTLSVSNDYADVDSALVFAPDSVSKLAREPDQTYSDVIVEYATGKVHRYREATATTYVRRGTTISRPYTGKATTAQAQAEQFLNAHSVETDRITCTIQVPAASVGLIQAGMTMNVRFTHLPSYESGAVMRIVGMSPRPTNDKADFWNVELELVGPKPVTEEYSCTSNVLAGLIPTEGACNIPPGMFTDEARYIHTPAYATDGVHSPVYAGGPELGSAYYGSGVAFGDWIQDFLFTLPSAASIRYVVAKFQIHKTAEVTDWFPDLYMVVDGTDVYDATTYATEGDNGYGWDEGTNHFCATWDFGSAIPVDTLALRRSWDEGTRIPPEDTHAGYIEYFQLYEICAPGSPGDEETDLGAIPGATTTHTTDPTADDDVTLGYSVGSTWINTTDGGVFISVDSTDGNAVWVEVSGAGVSDHGALTGLLDDDHTQYVLKRYGGKEVVSTVAATGAAETIDLANGNVFDETLTADCTFTFAGATNGVACSFTLLLRQDGTGGWTTTWPGSVVWTGGSAPTLDETASTAAVLTFFTLDGGTIWYGFPTGAGDGTPATTVTDETTWGIAPAVGSDSEYARQDHTHGSPAQPSAGVGPILLEDTPAGSPLVFADLLQNEEGTDLLYADAV